MSSFSTVITKHYPTTLGSSKLLFRFKQMSSQSYQFDPATINITVITTTYQTPTLVYAGSGYPVSSSITFTIRGSSFFTAAGVAGSSSSSAANNDVTVSFTTNSSGGLVTGSIVSGAANAMSGTLPMNVVVEYNVSNYIMRDASDITRALKERIIYNEKRTGSPINSGKGGSLVFGRPGVNPGSENSIPAGNAEMLWIPQGNQYRLSYLFGKLKCGAGSGGAFNLNGPIQRS